MSQFQSKYSIELVNKNGLLLADMTGRATKRSLIISRNQADDISWSIDLNEFENYCKLTNQDPLSLLVTNSTEVRIKRLGKYLSGGQMYYYTINVDSQNQKIDVRATGFLNLFKDRFTVFGRSFLATQATTIAATLINDSQALTNGNYGITIGSLATVGLHNRTYDRNDIKTCLVDLTRVQNAPFDFEFTYNKVFNTYAQIGSVRPDIIFEYPNNIISFSVPNDGTGIANEVLVLGKGFGTESGTNSIVTDTGSQLTYSLRQKIITSNGNDDTDSGLSDAAKAEIAAWAFPFEIPSIVVNGNVAPFITDYKIGDRVKLRFNNYKSLKHITAYYRIERIELTIDEEDNETVKLSMSI